jgi:DNA-directed RNA polymerase specialized sigma24 family protein
VVTALATDEEKIFGEVLLRLEPLSPTTEERYNQLRLKLIKFFSWRACEDPEALADETISRLVKNLVDKEITHALTYSVVYAIALNLYREYERKEKHIKLSRDLYETLPSVSENIEDCRAECLERCSPGQLTLLKEYYLVESREKLAQALGISTNALRLKVHRLKSQLQSCYQDCIRKKSAGG